MTPEQLEVLQIFANTGRLLNQEVVEARMLRDVLSERQVEAVMTDFWLNHFSTFLKKNVGTNFTVSSYERDTFRKNALGNFEELLVATATSSAMLLHLDNNISLGPHSSNALGGRGKDAGLNENYARELLELHTLGVNGGYTQQDKT